MTDVADLLACPRCDSTPLAQKGDQLFCTSCKVSFPRLDGIPWMFAEPGASLDEWRGRLHFVLQQLGDEISGLDAELQNDALQKATEKRVRRYRDAVVAHRQSLQELLQPLAVQTLGGSVESYLALRTRLPTEQGLNTYYANIHRDWAWGDEENRASLAQIESVLQADRHLGKVLVLGAGAGRLAYDMHRHFDCTMTVAMDFNPLLVLVASAVTRGDTMQLHEFPIAPKNAGDDAVLRTLAAPEAVDSTFQLLVGDALRPPFPAGSFDTVVTPWLIDIVADDLGKFSARINNLLAANGRWLNFGSLAFASAARSRRYGVEETLAIVADNGFAEPYVREDTIPYMCSPASRHGRQETVFSFCARKQRDAGKPERYRALPEWLVTGKDPVPLSPSFRTQAMTTQIYAFIMSLIDGKRSIRDMAAILETRKLMPKDEAATAIRSFLIRMYDDSRKPPGL